VAHNKRGGLKLGDRPAIVIAATLDTKAEEVEFVRAALERRGRSVIVVDCGILGRAGARADVPREAVAQAGGSDLGSMQREQNRETAIPIMLRGLERVIADLFARGRVAGYLGLGGGTNAALAAAAFKALPFGVSKVLVSTVACGNTRPFVGTKDVVLFHSVVDILGLNHFLKSILTRAAAAIDAMIEERSAGEAERDEPCIAVTAFGSTTEAATQALGLLSANGFEVLTFHARGVGGEAMEEMIREGRVDAVLDLTTTEIADEVVGGICSAGPNRLEAAGERGIPQVVLPGAIDMVNFGPPATVPPAFRTRRLLAHTPHATLMRTTAEENAAIAAFVAAKLNAATGPTGVVLPLRGFSAYDREGGPFFDPVADAAFRSALTAQLKPHIRVRTVDAHINQPEVIRAASSLLLDLMSEPAGRVAQR
jgi:uncharacterized protein (UPF0261 family)